ncbi:zeta toxin family protein [Limnoglobus roseus]|uniref:Zeta toxin family protein n=1 Tax=Limnoglobus roseus TaxID=2598579 RepID=A0A5C1A973_9BACT|nr:zeta toxin family protein [Limnoglobus roseus]QEL14596.1 Zeta toxin family protein [Limnoglobus roseus]
MPRVVVLAGINGAGKTTASQDLLTRVLEIPTFVNADAIARGLNGLNPEAEAFRAGRIMLQQMDRLAEQRESFAFETTLAARTYASWLGDLRIAGYEVYLFYYWLESPELAIGRVASRVKSGGHFVPDDTIRQRYSRSVRNFFELYRQHADVWEVNENSFGDKRLIGCGFANDYLEVVDPDRWAAFERSQNHG